LAMQAPRANPLDPVEQSIAVAYDFGFSHY